MVYCDYGTTIFIVRKFSNFDAGKEAIQTLAKIVTYAIIINVFFVLLEVFTVFYSGIEEHMQHFKYLYFRKQKNKLHITPFTKVDRRQLS